MGGGSSLPFELQRSHLWIGDEVCAQLQAQVAKQQAPPNSSAQASWLCLAGHQLEQRDDIGTSSFTCDECNCPIPKGTVFYGCRICNYDRCSSCAKNLQEKTGTNIVVEIRLLSGSLVMKRELPCGATAGDLRRALQGAPVMQHTRLIAGPVTLEDHHDLQSCADENGKVEICIVLDPGALHVLARQKYEREQDVKFKKYMAENTKLEEELGAARKTMYQDNLAAQDEEFYAEAPDPNKYAKLENEIFEKFCRRVEELNIDVPKTEKPSVALLGPPGAGKSALINALVGTLVTPEGVINTTAVAFKVYESPTTEFWDVPGSSEESLFFNLKRILAIKEMHLIIIPYVDQGHMTQKLEKFIQACKVDCICVRNKVDMIVDLASDAKKAAFELEAAKLSAPLIFVSAKTGEGLDSLKSSAMKLGVSLDSSEDSSSKRKLGVSLDSSEDSSSKRLTTATLDATCDF